MDERYELYHAGIKGMKWGIRRYQNKDGSLTPLGRIRYGAGKAGDAIRSATKKAGEKHHAKRLAKKEEKRVAALMKKPIRKLTADELKERTDRVNKEKQLRDAENQAGGFVKKLGSKLLDDALVPGLVTAGKSVIQNFTEKTLKNFLGIDAPDLTNTGDILKKVKGDYNKLTDAQAKALAEREKNLNTARQNEEQRKRVGGDNTNNQNNQKKSDDNSDSQKNKKNSGNNQSNKSSGPDKKEESYELIVPNEKSRSAANIEAVLNRNAGVPVLPLLETGSGKNSANIDVASGSSFVERYYKRPIK